MNSSCWVANSWAANSWVADSWCPETPPTPLPNFNSGGISYDDFLKRKKKKDDEEILFL